MGLAGVCRTIKKKKIKDEKKKKKNRAEIRHDECLALLFF